MVVLQYGLDYKSRVWSQHWQGKSSNTREAKNLTDWLKQMTAKLVINIAERLETLNKSGALADHEVFILTNNSPLKGCTTRVI